jgi:AraC-like DNA-binding protein
MELDRASPAVELRDCARCFEQRKASIATAAVVYPLAARPELFLEFYLRQRYLVRAYQSGVDDLAPRSVVVGPCTYRRVELVLRGHFDVFTIQFRASGFHRLFRMPMAEFVDRAYDARSVIGPCVSDIEQKLGDATSFEERVRIANDFLIQRRREPDLVDVVGAVAGRLFRERGALRVGDAAASAGLSVRQFERRFAEQVGLPPKQYARIIRFNGALQAKMSAPQRLWTEIAHEFGYYDQMHMIRDFERFAGESPAAAMRRMAGISKSWT